MTSPVSELLVQEGLCTELFKTISESVEASSISDPDTVPSADYSGDVIEQLIDHMIQILPPEERDIFGTSEEKNIEDIIQEANELIRSTTPLFSFSESGEKSWNTSKGLSVGSKANESSKKVFGDVKEKSRSGSTCSSIESILVKEDAASSSVADVNVIQDLGAMEPKEQLSESDVEKYVEETQAKEHVAKEIDSLKRKANCLDIESNKMKEKLNEIDRTVTSAKENLKIYSEQSNISFSDSGESKVEEKNEENKENITNEKVIELKLTSLRQKHLAEIQELKQDHKKEVHALREQINRLTNQIDELKKQIQIDKSPDTRQQQLEQLEKELRSQEQLLAGYERENKKLCKEIMTLKENSKQQQSQLVEEKQRLQFELKGMVSRSTTEAMGEQLKDAKETIVKQQLELAEYRRRNKELESSCDHLQAENQLLQTQISNCRCHQVSRSGSHADQLSSIMGRERVSSVGAGTLQATLALERQAGKDLAKEKEFLFKENIDLKRQVKELESIVRRRQRSDSGFPITAMTPTASARLTQLEQELSARQESLTALHVQFISMQAFPVAFCLMTKKTAQLYKLILRHLKNIQPISPSNVVSDYEAGIKCAIADEFPQTKHVGCWFHFTQSIYKRVQRIGLIPLFRLNNAVNKGAHMLMAIALLPPEKIEEGYFVTATFFEMQAKPELSQGDHTKIDALLRYFKSQWIGRVGAKSFSVYGQKHRTNNSQESFHSKLNSMVGTAHPNIWSFIGALIIIGKEAATDYVRIEAGESISRNRKTKWLLQDRQIMEAQQKLEDDQITIFQFLSTMAHRVRPESRVEDPEEDDQEEVVPLDDGVENQGGVANVEDVEEEDLKKYEEHTKELEDKLKRSKEELQTAKANQRKEDVKSKKLKQVTAPVKEETHLLATIRGLRQEVATREKEITKLNKEMEELRQTNRRLQKEREKHLNSMPNKTLAVRDRAGLRKDRMGSTVDSRSNLTSPNNNVNPLLLADLQESNLLLSSKTKTLQEEVKRLEKDLIAMHNKRVHDLKVLQSEHDVEMSRLLEERSSYLAQTSTTELQDQIYTQQMVINHLKNRLKQMEELKSEVMLLRAERDHLEQSLAAVNHNMTLLQSAQSPEGIQYKTLLAKLENLEKNQEIREQKLNAVRELLRRSTQGQGPCGSCRDKLLDKNRQICYYRAQMDRILESLLDVRRTK